MMSNKEKCLHTKMTNKRSRKFKRSRTGCWTCKARKRKCDEAKPVCMNCVTSGRNCLGYQMLLAFDVDGNRDGAALKGRPKLKESLAARGINLLELSKEKTDRSSNFVIVTTDNFKDKAAKRNKSPTVDENTLQQVVVPQPTAILPLTLLDSSSATDAVVASSSNDAKWINPKQALSNDSVTSTSISSTNEDEQDTIDELDWNSILWNIDISQLLPKDENFFVNHFMHRLVQMFDNLENSPFPNLVLKYCEPDLAQSCFVTLSSIHLYGYSNDVNDYDKSVNQLDVVTNELLSLIAFEDEQQAMEHPTVPKRNESPILLILRKLQNLPPDLKPSRVITVLILIYVQTMFSILESGRSAITDFLFELASRICYDITLRDVLVQDEQTKFLVMLIAWFETITALSSPNVRKSYLRKFEFEGQDQFRLRSEDITGCPDEIFTSLLDILDLRFQIYTFGSSRDSYGQKKRIITTLYNYRDFVPYTEFQGDQYIEKLLGAQCWSLASLIYIHKLLPEEGYEHAIAALVTEFLFVFALLDENSDIKKQCIWPLLVVGEMLHLEKDRNKVLGIFDMFYDQNKMGNIRTLQDLLKKAWCEQRSLNSILEGGGWGSSGIELLPL